MCFTAQESIELKGDLEGKSSVFWDLHCAYVEEKASAEHACVQVIGADKDESLYNMALLSFKPSKATVHGNKVHWYHPPPQGKCRCVVRISVSIEEAFRCNENTTSDLPQKIRQGVH
jgi:hypothetical protein